MNDRYGLGGLGNDQLLASLTALVQREDVMLSDMLAHLAELDERDLCLELGYPSLFKYCTDALGFCLSSAGRRIAAARVCRRYPEALARVAKGELKLSVLCALNKYLNLENAAELFVACSGKSYEQVELLLAARFPKPDVRDLVRRLPVKKRVTPDVGCAEGDGTVVPNGCAEGDGTVVPNGYAEVDGVAARSVYAGAAVAPESRQAAKPGTVKPLSAERFSVNFTADSEFRELLEEVRALVSHAEPKGDLMSVMKRGLEALRSELLKKRLGVGRKPRRVRSSSRGAGLAPRTRYIAADVARAVWARDGEQCTFSAFVKVDVAHSSYF